MLLVSAHSGSPSCQQPSLYPSVSSNSNNLQTCMWCVCVCVCVCTVCFRKAGLYYLASDFFPPQYLLAILPIRPVLLSCIPFNSCQIVYNVDIHLSCKRNYFPINENSLSFHFFCFFLIRREPLENITLAKSIPDLKSSSSCLFIWGQSCDSEAHCIPG